MEFAEAKERLKASWAVDRDDFARVKEQLKKKNAEHHVQNGRLSQSLKVSCQMLYCLLFRADIAVLLVHRSTFWGFSWLFFGQYQAKAFL